MAFTNANLLLLRGGNRNQYYYDAGSDTMATILAAGYFDNVDDVIALQADDLMHCECTDGNMVIRVSAVTANTVAGGGDVTVQFVSGNMPIQTWATGTEAAMTKMAYGFYEVGSTIATATRGIFPVHYAGAIVRVIKVGSGTQGHEFDVGASASDVSLGASGAAAGGGTGVTADAVGNRRFTTLLENEQFTVVGSSTSRWRVQNMYAAATVIMEGGSRFLAGT